MVSLSYRPLRARVRVVRRASSMSGRAMNVEDLESCPLLCLSVSATTPGRHFAAGRVACFAECRIGYREWARRNGKLGDIHSIGDPYDQDIDELMA